MIGAVKLSISPEDGVPRLFVINNDDETLPLTFILPVKLIVPSVPLVCCRLLIFINVEHTIFCADNILVSAIFVLFKFNTVPTLEMLSVFNESENVVTPVMVGITAVEATNNVFGLIDSVIPVYAHTHGDETAYLQFENFIFGHLLVSQV